MDVSLELDIECAIHYDIHCKRIDVSKFIRTFLSMLFLCLDHHNLYHEQKNLAHKTEVLSVMLQCRFLFITELIARCLPNTSL